MKKSTLCSLLYGAVLAALAAGTASANPDYQLSAYEDELQLCIDLLRPALGASNGDRITYVVEQVDLRGPWYRFEISATKINRLGKVEVDGYNVGCKSNRRVESARLLERQNEQQPISFGELFAKQ